MYIKIIKLNFNVKQKKKFTKKRENELKNSIAMLEKPVSLQKLVLIYFIFLFCSDGKFVISKN
jgi:hypothetical protein